MISLPSITEVKQQFFKTAKRFPLPTLCAGLITLLGTALTHEMFDSVAEDWAIKALLVSILGLSTFTGLTLTFENTSPLKRNLALGLGVGFLGLYFYMLPTNFDHEGSVWVSRHIFLCLASVVTLFWAPYWQQNVDNKVLWHWSSLLIGSAVITLFFSIVLFLGLIAALWSIDSLFNLEIKEKLYFDIWVLIAALFSPLFWLSQFPPQPLKLKAPKQVPPFMGIFIKYIMTPLALGYLVILYAYTVKILMTWEWPKNVLGWLVIAFLGVAIFTYFLWTPLFKLAFEKYRRIFWLTLIPQICLLFVAIGWRIHTYSWTENRYFVIILGLWLLGTTLYFLIRKTAKFKWIFVALTLIILVSQMGPFSGYAIGKKSQTSRLMTLLEDVNVKQGNRFKKITIQANTESENQIASILDYLKNRHGEEALQTLFPDLNYDDVRYYNLPKFIMDKYGLDYRSKWDQNNKSIRNQYFNFYLDQSTPYDITGYDWRVVPDYTNSSTKNTVAGYQFKRNDYKDSPSITVLHNQQVIETIELANVLNDIAKKHSFETHRDLTPPQMHYDYESDLLSTRIYFTNFSGEDKIVSGFEAVMYVRFK